MARKMQKAAQGGAPISSHPAFPAIVALWFAALFGIGSLVLPTALFESIITGIGVDKILPATAPPLGFTARGMIALLVAGVGLAAGLVLARKVAQSQSPAKERSRDLQLKAADRHPDAPAKRPISARRELGSEGLGPMEDPWKFEDEWAADDEDDADDGYDYDEFDDSDDDDDRVTSPAAAPAVSSMNIPGRRRALSVTDDSGPSDYLQTVPLPGQSFDEPLELDILEEEEFAEDAAAIEEFASETAALRNEAQSKQEPAFAESAAAMPGFELLGKAERGGEQVTQPVFAADPTPGVDPAGMFAQAEVHPSAQHAPGAPVSENDFATSFVQEEFMSQPNQPNQPNQPTVPSFSAPNSPQAALDSNPGSAPGRNALSDLGMAELVERFATAMQAKADREEQAASAPIASNNPFDGANPFADRAGEADLASLGAGSEMASGRPFTSPLSSALSSETLAAINVAADVAAEGTASEYASDTLGESTAAASAPMVFRRSGGDSANAVEQSAPVAEELANPAHFASSRAMPSALQPVHMFDDEEDDDDTAHAPLSIDFARQRPFAGPVAREDHPDMDTAAPFQTAGPTATPQAFSAAPPEVPLAFTPPEAPPEAEAEMTADDEESQDAYSSLLNMKSKLSGQEFVRVEEEDADDALPEPVVVFPGQNAKPYYHGSDGASNDYARVFDAPASTPSGANPVPRPTTPPSPPSDPTETERALREALEKLQRMSGAA